MFCRKAAGVTGVKQNTHHFFNGQIAVAYRHGIQLAVCDRDARTAGVFRKRAVFAVYGLSLIHISRKLVKRREFEEYIRHKLVI